jgi:hypothetical protein
VGAGSPSRQRYAGEQRDNRTEIAHGPKPRCRHPLLPTEHHHEGRQIGRHHRHGRIPGPAPNRRVHDCMDPLPPPDLDLADGGPSCQEGAQRRHRQHRRLPAVRRRSRAQRTRAERGQHRPGCHPARAQRVHPGGGRRRRPTMPGLSNSRSRGESTLGEAVGSPARRSVKRRGPSSSRGGPAALAERIVGQPYAAEDGLSPSRERSCSSPAAERTSGPSTPWLTAAVDRTSIGQAGSFGVQCAAVESFVRTLAVELGLRGIRAARIRSAGSPDAAGVNGMFTMHTRNAGVGRADYDRERCWARCRRRPGSPSFRPVTGRAR